MQVDRQPDYPLLYSLQGFQYCDLLLAEAERGGRVRAGRARRAGLPSGRGGAVPAGLPGGAGAGEADAGLGHKRLD